MTGVPSGKTTKEITYDLSQFICGGGGREDDTHSSDLSMDADEMVDEEFDDEFTLSLFRRNLMVHAAEQFLEKYGV